MKGKKKRKKPMALACEMRICEDCGMAYEIAETEEVRGMMEELGDEYARFFLALSCVWCVQKLSDETYGYFNEIFVDDAEMDKVLEQIRSGKEGKICLIPMGVRKK